LPTKDNLPFDAMWLGSRDSDAPVLTHRRTLCSLFMDLLCTRCTSLAIHAKWPLL